MKARVIYYFKLAIILLILSSCDTSVDNVKKAEVKVIESKQDLNKARDDFDKDVKEFRKEAEQKISNNELIIAGFKLKLTNKNTTNKLACHQKIKELEIRNNELKKRMNDYQPKVIDSWEPFKSRYTADIDNLKWSLKYTTIDTLK